VVDIQFVKYFNVLISLSLGSKFITLKVIDYVRTKLWAKLLSKELKRKSRTMRIVYVRITVHGILKECSKKRHWDVTRWNQKEERAIGTKEDAKELNFFLDSFRTKINSHRT